MSWEHARRYAQANIDRICAEQGITVEITDAELVETTIRLLRSGKANNQPIGIEVPTSATSR